MTPSMVISALLGILLGFAFIAGVIACGIWFDLWRARKRLER